MTFQMRAPCACGSTDGVIVEKNGQDTVRCGACSRYQYCAPRTETGRKQRSVSTVHNGIKPGQKARILERATARCEVCGSSKNPHVAHIISVDVGLQYGLTDREINDDENLMCMCEECNLGWGSRPLPLRIALAVLRARIAWRDAQGGAA